MNETLPKNSATLQIFGRVDAPDFPEWIARHAAKLGLRDVKTAFAENRLEVYAAGDGEMLNALALACALGPRSVLVDRVDFNPELKSAKAD